MLASKALPHAGCLSQVGHQCHSPEHRSENRGKIITINRYTLEFSNYFSNGSGDPIKMNIRYVSLPRDNYRQRLLMYLTVFRKHLRPAVNPPTLINYSILLEHRQIISILICT